ncbi:DUF1127 domain-containing protein [Bartonella henselae]|nr:DUF1127 domain-containing protein [Bartonella henselae]UAK83999.1 DUF1127 domain-containing protein [Bartonella henselae]UJM41168.1 DUF1127 domain-containing protein [Bartonella henselae]
MNILHSYSKWRRYRRTVNALSRRFDDSLGASFI